MSSHAYDPRGKVNRALLVGVYRYDHYDDLPGVKHNLGELFHTLLEGGVFGAGEIRTSTPVTRIDFLSDLELAVKKARGLLLLYFAGHGRLSQDGGELFLAVRESRRVGGDEPAYAEAVSWNRDVLPKLRDIADRELVDRIVVILDCCNAGNALQEFKPGALHLGRDRISVLAAVQVNRRIPAGGGHEPTPYTKQLIRLLGEGLPHVEPEQKGEIRLVPLSAALHEAMRGERTVHGDVWEPRHHAAESEQDVLLGLTRSAIELRPPRTKRPPRLRDRLRQRLRHRRPGLLVPLLTALAVLLAAGGYGGYVWAGGSTACAPPTELRLLTDPDTAPTVQKAVDRYLTSRDNHTASGCRRSGISLVAPKSTDAVAGFQHASAWRAPASAAGLRPQRDIGAQPDIWLPGSDMTVQRASSEALSRDVELTQLGSVAYSPIVLAVPTRLAWTPASQTGYSLQVLLKQLKDNNKRPVAVLRADPEYTDSAQLATVGVYDQNTGSTPQGDAEVNRFEQQASQFSPAALSSYDLMCGLADPNNAALENDAAVLVPEQVMAQFNVKKDAKTRLGCDTGRLSTRAPQYPANVRLLDLPFVRVTWRGATQDAKAREQAVAAFHDWLIQPDGQKVFTDAGYRGLGPQDASAASGAAAAPAVPEPGSWLVTQGKALSDPGPIRYDMAAGAVTAALDRYRRALGPGRVLYLLDSSSSMDTKWAGSGRALDLLTQSLSAFSAQDEYGVWTVVDKDPATRQLVPLGTHSAADTAAVRSKVAGVKTLDKESYPAPALDAAVAEMTSRHKTSTGAQLIVYITDDEDDEHLDDRNLPPLLAGLKQHQVPVEWVSLASGGGCAKDKDGARIALNSGGRCLDASSSQVSELRDDVARVGTGATP